MNTNLPIKLYKDESPSSVLCDHLEGWDREGGRETQEGGDMGMYVYIQLTHFVIKQKLTHHCKKLYSNKDVKINK